MLQEMDLQEDRTTFVLAKISSLATREEKKMPQAAGIIFFAFSFSIRFKFLEPKKLKEASVKFQQTFNFPVSERLVNYFACTHGNRPGQIYLSINHISFYSYFLGSELKLVFRWIDVEKIELKTTLVAYAVKDWIKPNGRMFEARVFNFFRTKIFY